MDFSEFVRLTNDLFTLEVLYTALEELEELLDNSIITFPEYSINYINIKHDIADIYSKHNCPILIEI